MSHLDELIMKYCSDGVEFRALGSVANKSSSIKWSATGAETYKYIDLTSVDRVSRQIGDTAVVSAANAPSRARQIVREGDVIFAMTRPTQMRWAVISEDYDNQIASTGYCVLRPNVDVIMTKFLAHILGTNNFRHYVEANQVEGNYPSIPDYRIRDYRIPVPPMEVQREIVRILDTFSKMEEELEAELEARKQQYGYYRDAAIQHSESQADWLTLYEVAEYFGRGKSKHRPRNDPSLYGGPYPFIQTGDIRNSSHRVISHSQTYSEKGLKQSQLWPAGTICITIAANIAETGILQFEACFPDSIIGMIVDSKVAVPGYVEYLLRSRKDSLVSKGQGSAQANINLATFRGVRFPFPSLEEQNHIVDLLDNFDVLVNDLSVGLPAELSARRQQYEYYRDKLLTFKELEPAS